MGGVQSASDVSGIRNTKGLGCDLDALNYCLSREEIAKEYPFSVEWILEEHKQNMYKNPDFLYLARNLRRNPFISAPPLEEKKRKTKDPELLRDFYRELYYRNIYSKKHFVTLASRIRYHPDITRSDYQSVSRIGRSFSWFMGFLELGTIYGIYYVYRKKPLGQKMRNDTKLAFALFSIPPVLVIPLGNFMHSAYANGRLRAKGLHKKYKVFPDSE